MILCVVHVTGNVCFVVHVLENFCVLGPLLVWLFVLFIELLGDKISSDRL